MIERHTGRLCNDHNWRSVRSTKRHMMPCLHILAAALLSATSWGLHAQTSSPIGENEAEAERPASDTLLTGFRNPPNTARPRIWWHWINGNITIDGLDKDLAWMKRAGLGGVQAFDVSLASPQLVDDRLIYMLPAWKDAFRHAVMRARELGLEFAIPSSPGWSETGGPWVKPVDAMKKIVWSETFVEGGQPVDVTLPLPPSINGPFQNLPKRKLGPDQPEAAGNPSFYDDIAVLAYPINAQRQPLPASSAIGADGAPVDVALLSDLSLESGIPIPDIVGAHVPIATLTFAEPETIRSARFFIPNSRGLLGGGGYAVHLEAERGKHDWQEIAHTKTDAVPTTLSFEPVTSRRFRLLLSPLPSAPPLGDPQPGLDTGAIDGLMAMLAPTGGILADFILSPEARVDHFETKAGFSTRPDYYAISPVKGETPGAAPASVVDLTSHLRSDGTLDWTPPAGRWRIIRMGASLIGATNHPATDESTGLEVDKMDSAAVRNHLETYLANYRDAIGADLVGKQGVSALVTDSTEVGPFNWTPRMVDQFKRLRGYDPMPWFPALTGAIIGSRTESDRFLYDYRRTIADLHASEHYGTVAEVAHENGLSVYGEALETYRPSLGDDMAMRAYADVPMSAMWVFPRDSGPSSTYVADVKGAASIAHLMGRPYVAAESLTSIAAPWAYAPTDLRRVIDLEFALGVNRPVIHSSVHQPVDDKQPGLSLLVFGQHFNRHETWAEMARPWMDYIARTSFLLQQGRNVADVAYFYGEEAPLTGLFGQEKIPFTPTHYAYDFVNAGALLDRLSVENGDLVAESGARYRVLFLGGSSQYMTLPVLRRIAEFAEAGATILGDAPIGSPGLADDPSEYRALIQKLWSGTAVTNVGRGRVIVGNDIEGALAQIGLAPDFAYTSSKPDSDLMFVHRKLDDGEAYFIVNRRNRPDRVDARFRVTGKTPEIWRADDATIEPVSYVTEGKETIVPLELGAEESLFVMFRKPAAMRSANVSMQTLVPVTQISGGWEVSFQPNRGAPAHARFSTLSSLSTNADPAIRYFSGVAKYEKEFSLPENVGSDTPIYLDLGQIGDVAEVRLNGTSVGIAWHAPYRLEIGQAIVPGINRIEVRVANLWVNRLIGDAQPGTAKITWPELPTYRADAPLRPSGLMGPVTILAPIE